MINLSHIFVIGITMIVNLLYSKMVLAVLVCGLVIAFIIAAAVYFLLQLFVPSVSSNMAIVIGAIVAFLMICPKWYGRSQCKNNC